MLCVRSCWRLAPGTPWLAVALAAVVFTGTGVPAGAAEKRSRLSESKTDKAKAGKPQPTGPLIAVVSIGSQRVTVFDRTGEVAKASVSTGRSGYETPQGVFSVIQKEKEHYSNLYDDAPMPYMQRITWSGVAMHAGNLPGYRASHGCIRLPYSFSQQLFAMTRLGTRVVVTRGDVAPAAIAHPRLFAPAVASTVPVAVTDPPARSEDAPQPPMMLGVVPAEVVKAAVTQEPEPPPPVVRTKAALAAEAGRAAAAAQRSVDTARSAAGLKARETHKAAAAVKMAARGVSREEFTAKAAMRALESARTPEAAARAETAKAEAEARLVALAQALEAAKAALAVRQAEAVSAGEALKAVEADRAALARAASDAQRMTQPVSVFISRRTGKLHVRQAFQPVFDAPVTIQDPERPIGTHVFTAMEVSESESRAQWQVVTLSGEAAEAKPKGKGQKAADAPTQKASRAPADARAALERIDIPAETMQRIGELMSTGSSLVISDHPISNETGKGTDFIILTK